MRGTFLGRYRKNNQVRKKNRLDQTSDARFMSVWSSNFHKYPFKVTFRETSNARRFFLEHLLWAILFLNLIFFFYLCGTLNLLDRFDFHFFLIILPYIGLKPDKRKTIYPTAVRGAFSRRYRKNNQVRNKNRLDQTSDARFISVWSSNFHKYPL